MTQQVEIPAHLFDDIRTELLDREGTNIARKLANNSVAEAVIVQVQNVLDDLLGM